ncbi:MAG: DUF362 domain-containing protein [Calditrichaeota bacterium]|nr:MAG: DUF362 domain-containing protein [Calditrichota bacterium]
MNRRRFIQSSLLWGSGAAAGLPTKAISLSTIPSNRRPDHSRVVTVQVVSGEAKEVKFDTDRIGRMVDAAVEALFEMSAPKVWQTLFRRDDFVGLKVNCLAGKYLSTHQILTTAITERLCTAGIAAERIIIWDRRSQDLERSGYKLNFSDKGIKCYGNEYGGFNENVFEFGMAASQISKILSRCTAVINLPILKDHGIVGLSGALKNFFGAINNPNKYHLSHGDPYVADVNMAADIRHKTRLTLCDALVAQYEGGPPFMSEFSWTMNSLVAAVDMVAMDRVLWDIIDQKRLQEQLPTLQAAGREPHYILTAADDVHRLGVASLEKIERITIDSA